MTNPTPTNDLVKRAKLAAMGADDPANYVPRGISAQDVVDLAFCIEAQAAEIERLTAERDALQAKLQERALQELADLGQYTDWQIQAAEREAAAFRAGDEAMRKDAAKTSNQNDQPPQTPSTAPSSSCWCSSGPYCGNAGCYRRTQTTQRW